MSFQIEAKICLNIQILQNKVEGKLFEDIDDFELLTYFFALVRSYLELGSRIQIVWSPSYISCINFIEIVLRKFVMLLCYNLNVGMSLIYITFIIIFSLMA